NSSDDEDKNIKLDTTNKKYPEYVNLKKQVGSGQQETINEFAEGVKLNNLAISEKQKQIELLDRAHQSKDSSEALRLTKEAEEHQLRSEKNNNLSKEKFAIAQKKTVEVKQLGSEMNKIKSELVVKNSETVPTLLA